MWITIITPCSCTLLAIYMYHWYQSFKCNGWKFLKKQSCNSEFHAQAIIMCHSFFRGSAKLGGQTVNEIHVNKQKRDDHFVPPCPWEPLSSLSFTCVSLDASFPLLPSRKGASTAQLQSPGNKWYFSIWRPQELYSGMVVLFSVFSDILKVCSTVIQVFYRLM